MRKKPHSDDPGYRCALLAPFGQAVVYDRSKGAHVGASIGRRRWAVVAYDKDDEPINVFDVRSEREARDAMKWLRDGTLEPKPAYERTEEAPERPAKDSLVAMAREAGQRLGLTASYAHGFLKAGRKRPASVGEALAMLRTSNGWKNNNRRTR